MVAFVTKTQHATGKVKRVEYFVAFQGSAILSVLWVSCVLFHINTRDTYSRQNIIGFIKKQRLNWLGHVERMAEDNIVQKIKRWKPLSKRPIGRPKRRSEDEFVEDIKSTNISNWKKVAQNRGIWKKMVGQARTLYRL